MLVERTLLSLNFLFLTNPIHGFEHAILVTGQNLMQMKFGFEDYKEYMNFGAYLTKALTKHSIREFLQPEAEVFPSYHYDPYLELKRQGCLESIWQCIEINKKYKISHKVPTSLMLPTCAIENDV